MHVFYTSFNRWSFTGVRVTASLFRILLSILADLNAVVYMVSILLLIFNSSSLLGTDLSAPTTADITVTSMFLDFFNFSGKIQVFIVTFSLLLLLLPRSSTFMIVLLCVKNICLMPSVEWLTREVKRTEITLEWRWNRLIKSGKVTLVQLNRESILNQQFNCRCNTALFHVLS